MTRRRERGASVMEALVAVLLLSALVVGFIDFDRILFFYQLGVSAAVLTAVSLAVRL